jgi:hypothetical protein
VLIHESTEAPQLYLRSALSSEACHVLDCDPLSRLGQDDLLYGGVCTIFGPVSHPVVATLRCVTTAGQVSNGAASLHGWSLRSAAPETRAIVKFCGLRATHLARSHASRTVKSGSSSPREEST